MKVSTLVGVLDAPHLAAEQLNGWQLRDIPQAQQVLRELADCGVSLDLLAEVCRQLGKCLPALSEPDAALAALGRYFIAVRSPHGLAAHIERDPAVLPTLLNALALGPHWTELLLADPDALYLLRQAGSRPLSREELLSEIGSESAALRDERAMASALTRFRQRQELRIAYQEAHEQWSAAQAASQLTDLAEALVEAALAAAQPPEGVSVLAAGDLGARQASYRHDLVLLVVYEPRMANGSGDLQQRVERATKHFARLLDDCFGGSTLLLSLPEGVPSAMAHTADDVVHGFDSFGRTWHRQQLLKARPVAGDLELGRRVRQRLEPWLFRRYLNRADETGIQALKRRIVTNAALHQDEWRNVRLARGGLVDIEATVELLQLVVGNEQPAVRVASTLEALAGLAAAGVVSREEEQTLAAGYGYLTQLVHQVQIRYGPAADEVPEDFFVSEGELPATLDRNWLIIRRQLAAVFPEAGPPSREVELLLDPAPPPHEVRAALAPFGFHDPEAALRELNDLATEQIPFLSTRRCRHLLAGILPRLLRAISLAPDPDRTLMHLARVSNSLGGKAVLWDLFQTYPATLELYTKLCAASPYLSDILTTNPGMIDELVDSLQLDRLPTLGELARTLAELVRGRADFLPVLHDLKNAAHLRIGVRDILGKEDVDATHAALAHVAETCLAQVAQLEYQKLLEKHGKPTIGLGPKAGELSRAVILGLGKLGGREPNYHSQLDILLLYEADGTTRPARSSRRHEATANNHFFTRLAQQTIKQLGELTPKGRLYTVDVPLRPVGIGGALAMTFDEFGHHFSGGGAPLWQWQALTQARPVFGDDAAQSAIAEMLRQLLVERPCAGSEVAEVRRSRVVLERDAGPLNLKRAAGGTLDAEHLVQMLQLAHAAKHPGVVLTNTQAAMAALGAAGILPTDVAEQLSDGYRFLRRVESGLRLLNTSARHDLPDDPIQLGQLALLLGHSNPQRLREQCLEIMRKNREIFEQLTMD